MLKRPRGGRWRSATSTALIYRPRCEGNSPCLFDDGSMQVTLEYKGAPRFTESTPVPKSAGPSCAAYSLTCVHTRAIQSRLGYVSTALLARFRRPACCTLAVVTSACPRALPVPGTFSTAAVSALLVSMCQVSCPASCVDAQCCRMIANNCGCYSLTQDGECAQPCPD